MAKTANINVRIDPATKAAAEALFATFGITVTDAINIFLRQSIMEGGFPFAVRKPRYNVQSGATIQEGHAIAYSKGSKKEHTRADKPSDRFDAEK